MQRLFFFTLLFLGASLLPNAFVHADEASTTPLDSLDQTTGWVTDNPSAISLLTDSLEKQEGEGSLKVGLTPSSGTGKVYYQYPEPVDWSSYSSISFWIRSTTAASGTIAFDISSSSTMQTGSSTESHLVPPLSANTWTSVSIPLSEGDADLQAVGSYGFELPLSEFENVTVDAIGYVARATTTVDSGASTSTPITSTVGGDVHGTAPIIADAVRVLPRPLPAPLAAVARIQTELPQPAVATSSCPYFNRSLSEGSRSVQVKVVQTFLMARGFMPQQEPTTYFGKITALGVKKFQLAYLASLPIDAASKSGIRPTGNWTIATYHRVNQLLGCK